MRASGSVPQEIEVSLISPDSIKLREINQEMVRELAESIKEKGLQSPICVRKSNAGYVVIYGEHRLEAFKLLGLLTIPCIVRAVDDTDSIELKIVENIHRNNFVNPIVEGQLYARLLARKYRTVSELASKIGKSPKYVDDRIAISFKLDDSLKPFVGNGLGIQAACAVARMPDKKKQVEFANDLMKIKPWERTKILVRAYARSEIEWCKCPNCGSPHKKLGKQAEIDYQHMRRNALAGTIRND